MCKYNYYIMNKNLETTTEVIRKESEKQLNIFKVKMDKYVQDLLKEADKDFLQMLIFCDLVYLAEQDRIFTPPSAPLSNS